MSDRKEHYAVFPLQKVLEVFAKRQFDNPALLRLPMTGAVIFDAWIDQSSNEVVFRVYTDEALQEADDG